MLQHGGKCYTSWNLCSRLSKMWSISLRDTAKFRPCVHVFLTMLYFLRFLTWTRMENVDCGNLIPRKFCFLRKISAFCFWGKMYRYVSRWIEMDRYFHQLSCGVPLQNNLSYCLRPFACCALKSRMAILVTIFMSFRHISNVERATIQEIPTKITTSPTQLQPVDFSSTLSDISSRSLVRSLFHGERPWHSVYNGGRCLLSSAFKRESQDSLIKDASILLSCGQFHALRNDIYTQKSTFFWV